MITKRILLITIPLICILLIVGFSMHKKTVLTASNIQEAPASHSHPVIFFDEQTFFDGVRRTEKSRPVQIIPIRGGITPHHLFPGFILTDFYYRLSQQHPTTIILIGPNHYEKGKYHILTSLYSWETPFGKVEPDTAIIKDLVDNNLVHVDEEVLPNDHAVAGSMPFIRYYIKGARVVPLLISGFTTVDEVRELAKAIGTYLTNTQTVFVAPVDFSHYLTSDEAEAKDKVTLTVLKNYDYNELFQLNNDYLDSPPSIATLLMAMQSIHATHTELLFHTNSGVLQHNPSISTTSYFSIVYY